VHFEFYIGHIPTNALFINLVKSFKFTLKYTIIIVYFNANLKLLAKLINSAFVGVWTTYRSLYTTAVCNIVELCSLKGFSTVKLSSGVRTLNCQNPQLLLGYDCN